MPAKKQPSKKYQVKEIVKCGKDPKYFFNKYVRIQHPTRGLIPFQTYDFQDVCVQDFIDNRFNVVVKARQLGLSTLTAAYASWLALFHKDKNILIIATKLAVAQNFIKKVKVLIKALPSWLILPEIVADNKQSIEFSHGSSIKAIPTSDDAGRSEALSLLIIDEAAFVRNFDELWMGLYPTLSTGGRAIVLSTPNGVGGQYHKLYTDAIESLNDFNPITLPWNVHPERDDEWFKKETMNMTKRQIAQELNCDFASSGETFLTNEDIEWVSHMIQAPKYREGPARNVWVWKQPLSAHQYIVSADIARGDAKDFSTFHIIDTSTAEVVAEYRGKIPPDRFAQILFDWGVKYNNALMVPENNSFGYATILKLKELKYPKLYYRNRKSVYIGQYTPNYDSDKAGFDTQKKSRNQILTKLEEVLRNKQIKIYSSRLYDELKTFVWKNNKPQAMKGYNDDLVMSLAIGVWLYDTSPDYSKDAMALNNAMLKGMKFTRNQYRDKNVTGHLTDKLNPFMPISTSTDNVDKDANKRTSNKIPVDFDWLWK
ncbi:terminase family protein [bacterium]|nr:terminase family protein [bacterium]